MTTRTAEFEEEVMGRVEADPTTSTRRVAREMGCDVGMRQTLTLLGSHTVIYVLL